MLVFVAAHSIVSAQKKSEIVSGEYEGLILAIDPHVELTGYFDEGTGDDGKGNPRFTCSFFIHGARQSDGSYKISTWYPDNAGNEIIDGELKLTANGVNLHLNGEHGGCWNVAPVLKEAGGVDYKLTSAEKWQRVRVIRAEKSFFYASPNAKTPQKSFLVKNDAVRVLQTKGGAAEVIFVSAKGKTTKGWVKAKDFYLISRYQ